MISLRARAIALALGIGLLLPMLLGTAVRAQTTPIRAPVGTRGPVQPPDPPPFHWILPSDDRSAPVHDPPLLPDLSVQWIERTPRYSRYCLDYGRGIPELCPGTEADKRFPDPGEVVTFTAHIANQGPVASTAVDATWTVDATAESWHNQVEIPPLDPGITTTLLLTWPWQSTAHTVALTVDPAVTLAEITHNNNRRQHRTDALYLEVLLHPHVEAAFAARQNLAGSWSFADWMQAQVAAMNANLAAARFEGTPQGIVDRVRIDRIAVTELLGGDAVTSTLDFDGRWTFRVETDDPDTPVDEGQASAEAYAMAFAQAVDWGLVHELSHQLGAIDLYQLNVAGSYQNEVAEADGRPLLIGFDWPNPGLMGGGDRGDYGPQSYSSHTALALNRHSRQRRGYYGEYLFDLPRQNSLRALDNRGQPLSGASVTLYQTDKGTLEATAVATGTLDAAGRYHLPDRAVPWGGVTTATGHTLSPNPFGHIDVVGWNGQLLVRVSRGGQEFLTWWPITDFNLAAWRGIVALERTVNTHLPALDAPASPAGLDGIVDGAEVSLRWPESPDPSVVAYRVYRGVWPDYYPFQLITTTTALAYADALPATARYAVTTVDARGRESGFSPIFRAPRLFYPTALVVDPASGQRTALDRHNGALVTQLADGRWLGRQGSIHLGLVGSEAMTRNATGQLLIAGGVEDRIKILDAGLQPINWFGRERFVTGTLQSPAGILQWGEPFTVTEPAVADAATLGLARFEDDLTLSETPPLHVQDATRVPGRFGSGVHLGPAGQLSYPATGHLNPAAGSLEFWVRPDWAWDDGREHVLVEAGSTSPTDTPPAFRLRLAKADWNGLYAWLNDGPPGEGHDITLYAPLEGWQPGQWHHLALVWQPAQPDTTYRRYTLWVDGALRDSQVTRRPVDGRLDLISLGAGLDGRYPAEAVFDELHLSGTPRLGNSRRVRLIVSQAGADRLDVLDWLGNPISQFVAGDWGRLDSPQELTATGDRVLVADSGSGRVRALAFDGDTLSWQADWTAGLLRPHALASLPDGRFLVTDRGDDQVKLLGADGHVERRWTGPNDGQLGTFHQPGGIALLPDGAALVADSGNSRVVGIAGPLAPAQAWLPIGGHSADSR